MAARAQERRVSNGWQLALLGNLQSLFVCWYSEHAIPVSVELKARLQNVEMSTEMR
jgi:hypothetical protein